jgi:hypothetical protein
MSKMINTATPRIIGHVLVRDADSHEVLADRSNAIHAENLSFALASSLADRPNGNIMQMAFGNGASSVSAVGGVVYLPPNITGQNAQLYSQTYSKFVDDLNALDTDPTDDFMRVNHATGTTFSDVVVTCLLDYNEPTGQQALDDAVDTNGTFTFDEIALLTYDPSTTVGLLLSHVIFHPVMKSLNRRIEVIYTLRIVLT